MNNIFLLILLKGFSSDGDEAKFQRYREVELKHGRVAMLAVLGYVVPEVLRFPGMINVEGVRFADIPNGNSVTKTLLLAHLRN